MTIRVAIVGSEGKYWTPRQRSKTIQKIKEIFDTEMKKDYMKNPDHCGWGHSYLILVSGGCGSLGEDVPQKFDGGVDVWAEIVADVLGIKKDIKYAQVMQWKSVVVPFGIDEAPAGLSFEGGFKERNDEIARGCDVCYCIDPAWRDWSGGRYTMNEAKKLGKETHLILIE